MHMHEQWLSIAQEDLESAKHLFSVPFMTVLFHIQQCAEKSLKAYVVFKNGQLIRTHDLVRLVNACMTFDKDFEVLRLLAAVITPYETMGRYPDPFFIKPSIGEVKGLIEQSEYVFNFVTSKITIT